MNNFGKVYVNVRISKPGDEKLISEILVKLET